MSAKESFINLFNLLACSVAPPSGLIIIFSRKDIYQRVGD